MKLQHAFEAAAAARPGKLALVVGVRRIDYAALLAESTSLARLLRGAGVVAGDRVVVFIGDAVLYAVALHAVLMAGATFVPVNAGARPARLAFVLRDVRARLLLTETAASTVWGEALASLDAPPPPSSPPVPREWPTAIDGPGFVACLPLSEGRGHEPVVPADLAAILYTSGTTGVPKGVMLTHANMLSAWASVQAYLGLREDDVIALPLAPTFSYGLYHLLMGLGLGATVVAEPSSAFPRVLLQRLAVERATVLPGVPMLFAALLGAGEGGSFDASALPALRLLTNAAAALPVAHLERIASRWPRALFFSMYGMTECKRISYLPPEELARRPTSVGRGMPGQQHWLIDEAGHRLGPEGAGELVVRGPHVMAGYWQRPAETADRLARGADGGVELRTGDLFRTDAEGYLYFVARKDDIIKTRGEKVSPREVENVLSRLPGVREAAVVGVPDPVLGQAVKAFIVAETGSALTARQVIRHCLASLESYMAPNEVAFVPELPQTESGKLRRAALVDPPALQNARPAMTAGTDSGVDARS